MTAPTDEEVDELCEREFMYDMSHEAWLRAIYRAGMAAAAAKESLGDTIQSAQASLKSLPEWALQQAHIAAAAPASGDALPASMPQRQDGEGYVAYAKRVATLCARQAQEIARLTAERDLSHKGGKMALSVMCDRCLLAFKRAALGEG